MFQKGQFLGLFCKVIGNIRKYLMLFNNYTALGNYSAIAMLTQSMLRTEHG